MFLNRQRAIPVALNRDEDEIAPFSSKNSLESEQKDSYPL